MFNSKRRNKIKKVTSLVSFAHLKKQKTTTNLTRQKMDEKSDPCQKNKKKDFQTT